MNYKEEYEKRLSNDFFDDKTREELRSIESDEEEIKDRFYQKLSFGTAGLRGKIGAGSNRMNLYTVAQASQGLACTILDQGKEAMERGVIISYDVRHMSKEFAKITAEVLAGNGIRVKIFDDIQPTPVCSYAIRHEKTVSGVMITASHNPREYNGYKAYNHEGSQILEETAVKIQNYMLDYEDFSKIKRADFDKELDGGFIEWVSPQVIEDYVEEILACTINDEINKDIKIVYTPLNGCGNKLVRRVLKTRGFENVHVVEEQENPDPDFTTVGYPNPEDPKAFKLAEELGKKVDADILLATDPDSDRCAVEIKDGKGGFYFLTGNKIGSLLTNYILQSLKDKGELPENGAIVKSLVSTDLVEPICKKFGVQKFDVLTGFKNIYEVANKLEEEGSGKFIFGFEESIGYNYKDFVRDKDAVNSSMMISEMAAYYLKQGKTLLDVLNEIYEEFGYYSNDVISIVVEGADGQERFKRIMSTVRENPFEELAGLKVTRVVDYLNDDTGLAKSNVLKYYFEEGSWLVIRPSGTEPKIKLYINAVDKNLEDADKKRDEISEKLKKIIDSIE